MERRNFFAALAACVVAPFALKPKAKPKTDVCLCGGFNIPHKPHSIPWDDDHVHFQMHAAELNANPMWVVKPLEYDPNLVGRTCILNTFEL